MNHGAAADISILEGAMGYYDASARAVKPAPMSWQRRQIRRSSSSLTAAVQDCL